MIHPAHDATSPLRTAPVVRGHPLRPVSRTGRFIEHTPRCVIGSLNAAASFWGGVGAKLILDKVFPQLARIPGLDLFFTLDAGAAFDLAASAVRFSNTMLFTVAIALPIFGGYRVFSPPVSWKQWAHARFGRSSAPEQTPPASIPPRSGAFEYLRTFIQEGVFGITALLKTRALRKAEGDITRLQSPRLHRIKDWLQSGPCHTMWRSGGRIAATIDQPLGFMGRVLPGERAVLGGLGIDTTVGAAANVVEAVIFGAPLRLSTFGQSGIINVLTSVANVSVAQHTPENVGPEHGFSKSMIWWNRTKIGVIKGTIYRAVCASSCVTGWFGYGLQAITGFLLMGYAKRMTDRR